MICEWGVKSVKALESRFAGNYEVTLAERATREFNVKNNIKENFLESLLCENLIETGSHSAQKIKEEDKEEIR